MMFVNNAGSTGYGLILRKNKGKLCFKKTTIITHDGKSW